MKRGPKPKPPEELKATGHYRPSRHGDRVSLVVPGSPPLMPDYLPAEAQLIWQDVLPRAMAAGVVELDSQLLARYCTEVHFYWLEVRKNMTVPAADKAQLMRMEERLGLAGRTSRVGLQAPPASGQTVDGQVVSTNPYANRGSRPAIR